MRNMGDSVRRDFLEEEVFLFELSSEGSIGIYLGLQVKATAAGAYASRQEDRARIRSRRACEDFHLFQKSHWKLHFQEF